MRNKLEENKLWMSGHALRKPVRTPYLSKKIVFEVGKKVQIGFMELTCVEKSKGYESIKDYPSAKHYPLTEPECWILKSAKGILYAFLPYRGLFKI